MTAVLATVAGLIALAAVLIVAGVYVLAGLGWCLLVAGAFPIVSAAVLVRGMAKPEDEQ